MSAVPVGVGKREAQLHRAFWIFVAAYLVVGALTLSHEHRWGDDWAQYVLHARNLLSGHPYPDTGYLFNPDAPYVGPASYPPGLPLLLAPFVGVFGLDILALKVAGLLCIALVLPVTLRLVAPVTGTVVAMAAMVLLALHPAFWQERQVIESEAPYLLFSMSTLWLCATPDDPRASRHAPLLAGAVLGILLYASVISRAVGITLIPALLVYGWAQRKPLRWFVGLALSFLLLLWLQTVWLVSPPTYEAELKLPTVDRVSAKPGGYLVALADLFPLPLGLSPVGAVAMLLASAAGIWFACTRPGNPGAGLRTLASRVPVFVWYLGSYLMALLIASVSPDRRLLVPVLPIILPLAAYGVHTFAMRFALGRHLALGAALAFAAYLLALQASGRYTPTEQMATCKECREMFAYVRDHTSPDSVIVFNKPRAMALFAGRRSWAPAYRYSPEQLEQRLAGLHPGLVVVGAQGSEFAARFPVGAALVARIRRPDAVVVFQNRSFTVVRLDAVRPGP